jgi:hypothetical protein
MKKGLAQLGEIHNTRGLQFSDLIYLALRLTL